MLDFASMSDSDLLQAVADCGSCGTSFADLTDEKLDERIAAIDCGSMFTGFTPAEIDQWLCDNCDCECGFTCEDLCSMRSSLQVTFSGWLDKVVLKTIVAGEPFGEVRFRLSDLNGKGFTLSNPITTQNFGSCCYESSTWEGTALFEVEDILYDNHIDRNVASSTTYQVEGSIWNDYTDPFGTLFSSSMCWQAAQTPPQWTASFVTRNADPDAGVRLSYIFRFDGFEDARNLTVNGPKNCDDIPGNHPFKMEQGFSPAFSADNPTGRIRFT